MAQRRKIGLIYRYDENWIGGTYYIQNLISALKTLPEDRLFELVIFCGDDAQVEELRMATNYPFLTRGSLVIKLPFLMRMINKAARKIIKKNIFRSFNNDIDLVFPGANESCFKKGQKFLYWIPDFQEHYLPQFFSETEIAHRKAAQLDIVMKADYIVFSSRAAKNDFMEIYPVKKLTKFILPFAVTHPLLRDRAYIFEKYKLSRDYFICCNQFWKHKDHATVIVALGELKKTGQNFTVVFTGKEYDSRNLLFFTELKQLVETLGLSESVKFLGFISREDQLLLMKNSVAVIQPSLFEGWSTVVEDAKALRLKIIASDIKVHKEQLEGYGPYILFSAGDKHSLADAVTAIDRINSVAPGYEKNVSAFAEDFAQIVNRISGDS